MPITALQPRRLHEQIADQIVGLIATGELPLGAKLPAERLLADMLRVSRGSLRQALVALEMAGIVAIRVSAGIFVTPEATALIHDWPAETPDGLPPLDIIHARRTVEGETAALAALHGTDEQIAAVVEAANALRDSDQRYDVRHPADRLFHIRIAEASGNKALLQIVEDLWSWQRGRLYQRLEDHFAVAWMRDLAIEDHQRVVDALMARDDRRARGAMHRHLDRVFANLGASLSSKQHLK